MIRASLEAAHIQFEEGSVGFASSLLEKLFDALGYQIIKLLQKHTGTSGELQ
jgi:hypothetical protein